MLFFSGPGCAYRGCGEETSHPKQDRKDTKIPITGVYFRVVAAAQRHGPRLGTVMRTFCLLIVLSASQLAAVTGCSTFAGNRGAQLDFEGRHRSYQVHVPRAYDPAKAAPLVIVLHGCDVGPALMNYLTRFNALSNREGFIVVYPKGLHHRWNSELNAKGYPGYKEPVDDVGFVGRVLDEVERTYRIDSRRVYVTGASNGGMLAHMVACGLSDRIAAAAPVIATLTEIAAKKYRPSRPIPILMIDGTKDPLVKWQGGALLKNNEGRALSVDATVDFWKRHDACEPAPERTFLPHRGTKHWTRAWRDVYKGETPDSEVVLYTVEGGGHTWPGGALFQLQCRLGHVNRDFSATDVIWEFFKRHPKSE